MTLKQLETFYWVSRLGGFAAAAQQLHSTQSAVSMRIQELEGALGVSLFDRNRRSARLTAKGQELVAYAERLMTLTSELQHRIGDPAVLSGTVRLGVTELIAISWLSGLVKAISEDYPGITLELGVDLTLTLLQKLQSGGLDLVLLPGTIEEPGLTNVFIGSVRFDWMASPQLGIPRRRLSPRDLHRWPLLTLTYHSNLHKLLGTWFEQSGARVHRSNSANSIGVLGALTIAGLGVSYLPRAHFRRQIEVGELQVLDIAPRLPDLRYFAVHERRPIQPLSPTIAALAQKHSRFVKPDARTPRASAKSAA